ncbi:MAG: XRE family transcriptional regulator [Flavobacterium sp.]|nr:MAG: XRE family transcriptional regulator [Flavobacterium sp.]
MMMIDLFGSLLLKFVYANIGLVPYNDKFLITRFVVMPTRNPRHQTAIETIAENVRSIRTEKGLTMVQLAEKCEVDYTTISKIERGIANTTVSMVFILAEALEVSASRLLEVNSKL